MSSEAEVHKINIQMSPSIALKHIMAMSLQVVHNLDAISITNLKISLMDMPI